MDVFHKILLKAYDAAGRKENGVADLNEILKREGFLSNIETICDQLCSEGWAAATDRNFVVKLTHWGVAEAKRTLANAPDTATLIEKQSKKMLASARELVIMLEEFDANPSSEKLSVVEQRFGDVTASLKQLRGYYSEN